MKPSIKKCLALVCAVCMVASITACGEGGANTSTSGNGNGDVSSVASTPLTQGTAEDKTVANNSNEKPAITSKSLNAKSIYSKVTYVPQMFYGCYALDGGYEFPCSSETLDLYRQEIEYWAPSNVCSDLEQDLTKIPFRIDAGPCTLANKITNATDRYWMCMYFQSAQGHVANVMGAYRISGNTLTFTPLKNYNYDEETNNVTYELSDNTIEYTFSFSGPNITLSLGEQSVTITARGLSSEYDNLIVNNYISTKSQTIGEIEQFDIYSSGEEASEEASGETDEEIGTKEQHFSIYLNDNEVVNNAVCEFSDDGFFTFSWKDSNGNTKSYQYAYFFCENDGLVLTDGNTNYFYNDSYSMRNKSILSNSITSSDISKLDEIDEEELKIIVEKRTNLLDELQKAFEKENINVNIDKDTGEIMLDSTILFGYDESDLSGDGKKFLNKFLKAYSSVILKDDYKGFVSKIMVEGHTDSTGDYDYNKKLSQNRANNVKNYCLSDNTGLDSKVITDLSKLMQAVGRASDEPVLDKDGKEDEDASRRVSFRFTINLD